MLAEAKLINKGLLVNPDKLSTPDPRLGHIPFGAWLLCFAKPELVVELGTDSGDSYLALCQVVEEDGLQTKLFTVDRWELEDKNGSLKEAEFGKYSKYHDDRYGRISRILRMTFDEAISKFEDGSIDLLLVGGLRSYESVKRDFEKWLPKVSQRGIVLLHGINEREKVFGGWRLWKELQGRHPNFEFEHSRGLGVLLVGEKACASLQGWLSDQDEPETRSSTKLLFERLGQKLLLECEMKGAAEARCEVRRLKMQLSHANAEVFALRQAVASAVAWQKRWLDRVLHRWRPPGERKPRQGKLRSFERSIRKRRNKFALWLYKNDHKALASRLWKGMEASFAGSIRIVPAVEACEIPKLLETLEFPVLENPTVSIIVTTYGKLAVTLTCLRSIAANMPSIPVEVIVVENCSDDPEIDQLGKVRGLRYIRHPENLGFLRSVNRGAGFARGEYIHLLNNDTQMTAGWLDKMLEVYRVRPDCGMVGSKLVFPDGTLQEAGGIVWNDVTAWNFGRRKDPTLPEFNYLHEVDYCTGASLLIRRDFFDKLGRFDERFVPAYYEDTDLGFKVREAGLKVYYQPESVVVHYEGMTHGTDTNHGIKAYEIVNRKKFREKWAEALDRDNFQNGQHVFWARDRSRFRKTVLVIDHHVPKPDRDAGSRSMMHIIKFYLATGFNVKFWPDNLHNDPVYTKRLQSLGVEVEYGLQDDTRGEKFARWLETNGPYIDYVLLSRPEIAVEYLPPLRRHTRAKILFYGHDIHHLRIRTQMLVEPGNAQLSVEAEKMEKIEQDVWGKVDVIYYPSEDETKVVRQYVARNGLDAPAFTLPLYAFETVEDKASENIAERKDIIFVASFGHPPNVGAVQWFVREVFPLILAKQPGLKFHVVGANPKPEILALASDNVKVHGFLPDDELERIYRNIRVAIAPLLCGGGMKGKVIEALRFGVPVVTTSIGAQGLSSAAGIIDVCDDPQAFAGAVLALMKDDLLWKRHSSGGLQYVQKHYSMGAMRRVFAGPMQLEQPAH